MAMGVAIRVLVCAAGRMRTLADGTGPGTEAGAKTGVDRAIGASTADGTRVSMEADSMTPAGASAKASVDAGAGGTMAVVRSGGTGVTDDEAPVTTPGVASRLHVRWTGVPASVADCTAHERTTRAETPSVAVRCSAMPVWVHKARKRAAAAGRRFIGRDPIFLADASARRGRAPCGRRSASAPARCARLGNLDIDFARVAVAFAVLLLSLTFHEAAHAWSADRLGDPTARLLGRVSLNPAVHVDPIGTIVFPLIAMTTGLPVIGWAKPVPVNTLNLRSHWKQKYMLIAAAGPASNLILAVGAAIIVRVLGFEAASGPVFQFFLGMVVINVLLAVFNMVPVPPLDGGNVLAGLLPGRGSEVIEMIRPWGFLIIYGLLLSGILFRIVSPIQDAIIDVLL